MNYPLLGLKVSVHEVLELDVSILQVTKHEPHPGLQKHACPFLMIAQQQRYGKFWVVQIFLEGHGSKRRPHKHRNATCDT